mmetsp:Transcript_7526/g.11081  ORF Transcript_7526/g.11081 Transcript_7526/m.11081 type:complete len:208 (-) Transcript_7526:153-776(-)
MMEGADMSAATVLQDEGMGDSILHHLHALVLESTLLWNDEEISRQGQQHSHHNNDTSTTNNNEPLLKLELELVEIRYLAVQMVECDADVINVTCANLTVRISLQAATISSTSTSSGDVQVVDESSIRTAIVMTLREGQTEGMYYANQVDGLTSVTEDSSSNSYSSSFESSTDGTESSSSSVMCSNSVHFWWLPSLVSIVIVHASWSF